MERGLRVMMMVEGGSRVGEGCSSGVVLRGSTGDGWGGVGW